MRPISSLELFAGAGGLALGVAAAGIRHRLIAEKDADSCATLKTNEAFYPNCDLQEIDLSSARPSELVGKVDVIAAGPPCQPFSKGGSGRGAKDSRNLFPVVFNFVRDLSPKAFIIENVRGLTQATFSNYVEYLRLQLQYPSLHPKRTISWKDQLSLLEDHHSGCKRPEYVIFCRTLNAADYGVAQKRERFFMVGFRFDICETWHFPTPTHSRQSLIRDQIKGGSYWDRHAISNKHRRLQTLPKQWQSSLKSPSSPYNLHPWQTVRDAISGLPNPLLVSPKRVQHHEFLPGARVYDGHNGSYIDLPSKTIKAGAHGVPGGENTVVFPDGSHRYYTLRECARIQSFPDKYNFAGSRTSITKQIGNAVPPTLARVIAESVRRTLTHKSVSVRQSE